ncbi:hypothetical protein ACMZOO_17540 (plasmid) [Catenovulum sp. SX2]|uniref:hypothetical protein n=1 Tax=Catenovulum sp. SX2 TaxID=3398614 RepID=UPI003F83FCFF
MPLIQRIKDYLLTKKLMAEHQATKTEITEDFDSFDWHTTPYQPPDPKKKEAEELAQEMGYAESVKHNGFQAMTSECKAMRMGLLEAKDAIRQAFAGAGEFKVSISSPYPEHVEYLSYLKQIKDELQANSDVLKGNLFLAVDTVINKEIRYARTLTDPYYKGEIPHGKTIGERAYQLQNKLEEKIYAAIKLYAHDGEAMVTFWKRHSKAKISKPGSDTHMTVHNMTYTYVDKGDILKPAYARIETLRKHYNSLPGDQGIWELVIINSISQRLKAKIDAKQQAQ